MMNRRVKHLIPSTITLLACACSSVTAQQVPQTAEGPGVPRSTSTTTTPKPQPPPPKPPTQQEIFAGIRSGVVRVSATGCSPSTSGSGSGFLVAPGLVATAAHVVATAKAISIRGDNGTGRATVIGIEQTRDVALLRIENPLTVPKYSGAILQFAKTEPQVSDEIAVIGYPFGMPMTREPGTITGTDGESELTGQRLTGLIVHNANTQPGNSGGPVVDKQGRVVGMTVSALIDQSSGTAVARINSATKAVTVEGLVKAWSASPVPMRPVECDTWSRDLVTVESLHPEAPSIGMTLNGFFSALENGSIRDAESYVSTAYGSSASDRIDMMRSQEISDIVVKLVDRRPDGIDDATVEYLTVDPLDGACQRHQDLFSMTLGSGAWQIEAIKELSAPKNCS